MAPDPDAYFPGYGDPLLENAWLYSADALSGGYSGGYSGGTGISFDLGPIDVNWDGSLPGGSGPSGPDVKEQLTALANRYEAELQRNLAAYQGGALGADQALASAWSLLDQFVAACYRYGAQGALSAAERDRRIDPSRLRWDWIAYYIDPISMQATGAPATPPGPAPVPGAPGGPYGAGPGFGSQAALLGAVLVVIILFKARKR